MSSCFVVGFFSHEEPFIFGFKATLYVWVGEYEDRVERVHGQYMLYTLGPGL